MLMAETREDIRGAAAVGSNKAEAFGCVKPFDDAGFHRIISLKKKLAGSAPSCFDYQGWQLQLC